MCNFKNVLQFSHTQNTSKSLNNSETEVKGILLQAAAITSINVS